MYRVAVLYGQPTDAASFDEYYHNTHMPIAQKMPGLQGATITKCETLDGTAPAFYIITELQFESREAAAAGLGSPEGRAAGADVANFATGGVQMAFLPG
ncbi:EthD family reductase [Gordonia sp. PDNC005]|uniref:EthD family reductase n=1 Tax=unclassified Gordonia (in: high G+C Gram-positive bacteria) TaxID=2657482 RepID=UPI001964263B|nr:EthD family reductase [Gordonia sp. PDNC005]QRY61656.1 EthD family reductase [Gordonia sp. PDNC005]